MVLIGTMKAEGILKGKIALPDGFEMGYTAGHEQGYADGYDVGNAEGKVEGKIEGKQVGYDEALSKRTDLVVTENGEYIPVESTGFKRVSVSVPEVLADKMLNGTVTSVTSDVTTIGDYALYYASALVEVSFPHATKIGACAFDMCKKLAKVYFPNVTTIGRYGMRYSVIDTITTQFPKLTQVGEYAFSYCGSTKTIKLPKATSIGKQCFACCYILESVDLPSITKISYNDVFNSCYSLKAVILRNQTMVTLSGANLFSTCYHFVGTTNATYNPNGLKDGYVYVPRSLVEGYKIATNWTVYADRFRALEDYTVDGTITGELDESKI